MVDKFAEDVILLALCVGFGKKERERERLWKGKESKAANYPNVNTTCQHLSLKEEEKLSCLTVFYLEISYPNLVHNDCLPTHDNIVY